MPITEEQLKFFLSKRAPFGTIVLSGKKGTGKTLACLNSPWTPVHILDTENSSQAYFDNADKLIRMGIFAEKFTRAECLNLDQFNAELIRIKDSGVHYGTLAIDTGGQWTEWVASKEQSRPGAEKTGQITWGKIRDIFRRTLIGLSGSCDCLILTAHERKYGDEISPRCNPALLEIAAMSVRLTRAPNVQIPSGQVTASRLPFFPPNIQNFSILRLLDYFEVPADWANLEEGELIPPEPTFHGVEAEASE